MEKELLIHGRYLLQRPLAQGQVCAVFKGFDQVLQRAVVVKQVPTSHIASYRDAIKLTAEFSHPNIIGIYDLIDEAEKLYIVQEYVEGDPFSALLQTQLTPFAVAQVGVQMCHALLYASVREVCHGDLTPSVIMRDRRGLVRLNNFALPSDLTYFTQWSIVGGDGIILSNTDLPWGKVTDERRADDVRAVGLLLYQLLAGRTPGAASVEPPADGRLRFLRNVPVELCELIARSVVRQHPQRITTVEPLYEALLEIVETMEPLEGASNLYQTDDGARFNQAPVANITNVGSERLVTALPTRNGSQSGLAGYHNDMQGVVHSSLVAPSNANISTAAPPTATNADPELKLVSVQDSYPVQPVQPQVAHSAPYQDDRGQQLRRLSLPILVALGVLVFVLFFVMGYFVAHAVFP